MRPQDLLASYILLASLVKGSVNLISRAGSTLTYNVYPNNRTDNGDEQRINSTLNGYGIDLTKIYFSKSTLPEIGVLYWEVNITSDQALQLNKSSDVAGVYTSCKNTKTCINPFSSGEFTELPSRVIYKRDDGLTQQTPLPARDEMVFISQASSVPLSSLGGKYVYDKSAGRDALVYVVDTGAYLSHPEFTNGANVRVKATWIYARPDLAGTPSDYNPRGHGTAMLSKITGDQYGISKNVNPVIVKIPATAEGGNGALDWVDGVRKAYEDYRVRLGNGIDEKIGAIISLSFHIPAASLDPPAATYFRILLQSLVSVGVLPITGAGNGADTPISGYPAVFASGTTPDVPQLMVIGNCNNDGSRYVGSQMAPYVTVYAPGQVTVAATPNTDDGTGTRPSSGTSDSAASVAGLAAYFNKLTSLAHTLKMDDSTVFASDRVQALKDYIENQSSYRRNSASNPKSFYNNVDSRNYQGTTSSSSVDLRISTLGDSITYGTDSTDGTGYRKNLQTLITGHNLRYIGSVSAGCMTNNDNEGHPGYTIDEIGGQAQNSLPERPNVVLLMAGTNDIVQNYNLGSAPTRLGNLIDLVLSDCPDATVLVASLTPLLDPTREANRKTYNQAIPGVIASRASAGKHVLLADMSAVTASDLNQVDGIHPNDGGYVLMAHAWYAALNQALNYGWIHAPVSGAAIPPERNCTSTGGGSGGSCSFPAWKPPQTIAYGVGGTDGIFVQNWFSKKGIAYGVPQAISDIFPSGGGGFTPDWVSAGQIANGVPSPGTVIFADINGDGRDDYLSLSDTGALRAWLNTGQYPQWNSIGTIAYGVGAPSSDIRFADVDCDGFADYLVITNFTVKAYLNLGASAWPKWGPGVVVFSNSALTPVTARFADINGDGCADYLLVDPTTGATQAGLNDHKFGSIAAGTIAGSVGSPGSAITFADINGDGRADLLAIGTGGSVHGWLNKDPGWDDIGLLAVGELSGSQGLAFAKLNPTAYSDSRADYLTINPQTGAVQAWMNHGYGDTIGAGICFADLDGDGLADYIFLTQDGHVRAFLNTGAYPTWTDLGIIATGFGSNHVIFADVNCDGRADYLLVDPNTGAVTAYYNLGRSSFPAWGAPVQIAFGVGTPGSWIQFADIDGDSCADYITVNPTTGAINAWLNTGAFPAWNPVGLLATGVGYPGSAIRLVDINGDGRADYVIVKEDGSALVYTNIPGSGVVPAWGANAVGLANGVGATANNILFADINGDGKADYLVVNPKTGGIDAYINQGSGGTSQAGNGVQFADLNGDGKSDYLWLDVDGSVHGYLNEGPASWPNWNSVGKSGRGDGANRQNVQFADVNCDGYDDYLVVNKFGGVTAYLNTKNFPNWGTPISIMGGVGTTMQSIRMHDVDGDGCADFLVVGPNGGVTAYLNLGASRFPSFGSPVLIATGVGAPRENIRFADINGDGLADYLIIDPVNGSTHAYISNGPKANPPWSYKDIGVVAYGVGVGGHAVIFADVNGDKKADYLKVDPATAAITAWLNPC